MASAPYPLQVTVGERYDLDFCLLAGGVPMPLTGWTAVAEIITNGTVVYSSRYPVSEFVLVQEPGGAPGWLRLQLPPVLTGSFLEPYGGDSGLSWRLYLRDDADETNLIHVLHGDVTLGDPS